MAIMDIDTAIKQSNALVKIKIEADVKALLSPLK
jgi:hypothetical protein